MRQFQYPNAPLNVPSLEVLEGMTDFVPQDIREQILAAPYADDVSGLRQLSYRFEQEADQWRGVSQPKSEIAKYVESNGIKVPKRYETLEEALHTVRQGGTVIIRSEHPHEYDKFSGLLKSYVIDAAELGYSDSDVTRGINDGISNDEVIHLAKLDSLNWLPMRRYLELNDQTADEFYKDMSFSFWDYVPGKNIAVVADDSIAGRYHITSLGTDGRGGAIGGIFNPAGQPFSDSDSVADSLSRFVDTKTITELVDTYEQVRGLPKFSQRQCAIMEMQLADDGTIWFLQYHKARPFRPNLDRLNPNDYNPREGWLQASIARGAIGSLVTLKTALWYPERAHNIFQRFDPDEPEDASFDLHHDIGFSETVTRNRVAYLAARGAKLQYKDIADGAHELRSRWFKPYGALAIGLVGYSTLIPEDLKDKISESIRVKKTMARVVVDVASDGLTGFVRLNPDSEQPIIGNYL